MLKTGNGIFIIAEVAGAHQGSLERARMLIDASAEAKADAVKFQIFSAEELVVSSHPKYRSFKEIEFSPAQWLEIMDYCRQAGMPFLADVFDSPSLEIIGRPECAGYKVHLTNLANYPFLRAVASKMKPIFLAVGGALPDEVKDAIEVIKGKGNDDIILMHGYQGYPTKIEEINFNRLPALRSKFNLPVGFLDHIDAESPLSLFIPLLSIAFEARCIEKHITLDRSQKGRDYYSSLEPAEFKTLVQYVREAEKTLGSGDFLMSPDEVNYRESVMKHIVASIPIRKGTRIALPMLSFKRTTTSGLLPSEASKLEGRVARVDIEKDGLITWDSVE